MKDNICPKCGGKLVASPIVLYSNPPTYVAHCKKCGEKVTSHNPIGEKEITYGYKSL